MLNPRELNQIACLAAEKERLSSQITQRVSKKEDQLRILSLANQMEDQLCNLIMQHAKKGYMSFPVSDLTLADNFCGLSQMIRENMITLLETLIRKAKQDEFKKVTLVDYPMLYEQMLMEKNPFVSSFDVGAAKIPALALVQTLIRFHEAGYSVTSSSEFSQHIEAYIRWDQIDFNLHLETPDFIFAANVTIAKLKTEIAGLRGIEQLQNNYEKLLEENKRLRETMESLLSLKKIGEERRNEGQPKEVS